MFGVVALFTAIGVGTEVVASGEFGKWLRMNQASRSIGRLSGHYVICAYGRVGRAVMEEMRRRNYALGGDRIQAGTGAHCWRNTASGTYPATRLTRPCSSRPASSVPGA